MPKPYLVLVAEDEATRLMVEHELSSRYSADYQVVSCESAAAGLARLKELRASGSQVPLVLADQWMTAETGAEFLARIRNIHPTARRGLLIAWGDRSTAAPILQAAALSQIDFYLPKPAWKPEERFHRVVTEALDDWWRPLGGRFEAVTVIGDENSARAHEVRDLLSRNNVPFGSHRTGSDEANEVLRRHGVDNPSGPVVILYNGRVLVDPSNAEVGAALGLEIRPTDRTYDLAIVGAGPAGLAAAVYAASEGLDTAVLEREAFGGQAGTSSMIRNYLGFPRGVSGVELASRAFEQAWIFGSHFIYGNPATSLGSEGSIRVLGLADGSQVRTHAVILATGVSYRRLGIPDLEALVGAGVYYGAATDEAKAMSGKHAFVVGGGNSAGQAAIHLSKYAARVSMLVRGGSVAASMSEYLIREIQSAENVAVRYGAEVVGGGGEGFLEHIEIRDRASGNEETVPAAGLFILIGAEPFTEWLPESVRRDAWGFILTGPDLVDGWQESRAPYFFESSMPGVLAVGDVRADSVKRVASAVGEGAVAVRLVHEYLAGQRKRGSAEIGR